MLNELYQLPEGFLQARPDELLSLLGKPTLIHLPGDNPKPLFVCTLLHGNETTGLYAIQALLRDYTEKALPRALSIFIGNVGAAAQNQRSLPSQKDYNRIWPGTQYDDCAETDLMKLVSAIMRKRKPFASIDIHNNTGHNPHYACVNILNPHGLQLASTFSNIAVHFTSPKGVQSATFSDFCPAVVLECGQTGNQSGITHARNYVETIIKLETISAERPENLNIFHTVARVTIPRQVSFNTIAGNDIILYESLELKNFDMLPATTVFAESHTDHPAPFAVHNESNEEVTQEFFDYANNKVILKKPVILSMYTTDKAAIRQDCLCYFMEHLKLQA